MSKSRFGTCNPKLSPASARDLARISVFDHIPPSIIARSDMRKPSTANPELLLCHTEVSVLNLNLCRRPDLPEALCVHHFPACPDVRRDWNMWADLMPNSTQLNKTKLTEQNYFIDLDYGFLWTSCVIDLALNLTLTFVMYKCTCWIC